MNELKVLIVDDEPEIRKSIRSILERSIRMDPSQRMSFFAAEDGEAALDAFSKGPKDLVIMDVRMPKVSGLEALKVIKKKAPETFVVMITAHSNLQDAVQSIKDGAYDYIEKPLQPDQVVKIVNKAIETRDLISKLAISSPIMDDDVETKIVGNSEKMKEVFFLIDRLSTVETNVLIRGENGTGKELVAQAIHYNSSRKKGEFVAINCEAIPEHLMESELFGHEKGAFTGAAERKIGKFQLASNGTIFLDEVSKLKTEMQVKLLKVIQEKTFSPVGSNRVLKTNARILAATNRNLEKMIHEGQFREDLFFRLNVMPIFMPPLRDRVDDIESLTGYFLKKFSVKHGRSFESVHDEVWKAFRTYRWPGNIRELENVIERIFVVERGKAVTARSLPEEVRTAKPSVDINLAQFTGPLNFDTFKESVEKEFILKALSANKGRINKTVADANIPKNTLLRKIKKYEINVKDFQ